MTVKNKLKLFNDPIYGFITIPNALIFDLIEHPYFQRLRRISQMGLSYLVYPGAHHTRFHHALGSMFLMTKAIETLRFKGVNIDKEEEEALLIAIVLHDIGHGPFSHAMEHSLVNQINHEDISLKFMEELNNKFNQRLTLAIKIFKGEYQRKFMCQLVSGQFDMDRADYLKRDSFYTGVAEGNINSERLINMLNVANDELVFEEKGLYSVEKFLTARRLMYWQVYLHKTGIVAENILVNILKRAKELVQKGITLEGSKALLYFLNSSIGKSNFNHESLEQFALLDDIDILSALKLWRNHEDFVLSKLCAMILDRQLLKVKLKRKPIDQESLNKQLHKVMSDNDLNENDASYFVFSGTISNQAYNIKKQAIKILRKNGKLTELSKATDHLNLKVLAEPVTKHYICYPKAIN
ncbi:MAG: HD domain-containing protein [bacterium]